MTTEVESATPAQVEQTEQVQEVESSSSEATTEQTQDQDNSQEQNNDTQEEKAKREPWFQKRIGELTREKYEARRVAEEARQQAEQYRQHLAQVQQGEQPQQREADVRTLAQQEAARMVAEQRFDESCNKVYSTGKTEFPDFDQAVANLQMVGVNRDFLELATTSDAGAKLLHHLGNDLDEAARILALSPVQMARELTKLEFKLNQPPPAKPVSKAPAPITPIGTGGVTESGLSDDLPIDEWMRRNAKRR
jgi:hypothetical protein